MTDCNIDTRLFKAHSVRGASATALLAAGVDQTLTRQRGGWTDSRAFDVHYARLHQLIAWDACLQDGLPPCTPQLLPRCTGGSSSSLGVADKGCLREPTAQEANSLSASAARAKSSVPEPTKEGEGKEDEHKAAEALRLLNVRQLVCPLGGRDCPACFGAMAIEAVFPCSACLKLVHVRCLQPLNGKQLPKGPPHTPLPASTAHLC